MTKKRRHINKVSRRLKEIHEMQSYRKAFEGQKKKIIIQSDQRYANRRPTIAMEQQPPEIDFYMSLHRMPHKRYKGRARKLI